MRDCLIKGLAVAAAIPMLLLSVSSGVAADLAKGGQLARQWCANCHVIGPGAGSTTQQGPPSLPSVAASGMTADQIRGFLTHPHGEMPDLSLSRAEIDDLIAYVQSLR